VLRRTADEQQRSIVATLYQAGNGIFGLFDKVLVLAEGREIYYGPVSESKRYFEEMGFKCSPGANVADFLTSIAVHTKRTVVAGFEDRVPNTTADFEEAYKKSSIYSRMISDMESRTESSLALEIHGLKAAREVEKNRSLAFFSREASPYLVSFGRQVIACTKRYLPSRLLAA
jgi:ATP-binding cassette subfamily G (WHITE) protein 2 (SNQ2)